MAKKSLFSSLDVVLTARTGPVSGIYELQVRVLLVLYATMSWNVSAGKDVSVLATGMLIFWISRTAYLSCCTVENG